MKKITKKAKQKEKKQTTKMKKDRDIEAIYEAVYI